jgi:putative ABC transport system ATP-binding protein
VSGCTKRYGAGAVAVDALREVDLEVMPGEFVVILGPSGSGKTTLLNVIGGIEEATSGRVMVAGTDIATLDADDLTTYRRDRVGFVFQFFNLVPTLTALENVQLLAEVTGSDAEARSRAALARVGLADIADRFPGQLSGGQQQRVAIARALVKEPPMVLCDEPTGSLDLDTGRQILAVLRDLAREGHHTVLLVTHNSAIAHMADRVVRLHSGTIASDERVEYPVEAAELEYSRAQPEPRHGGIRSSIILNVAAPEHVDELVDRVAKAGGALTKVPTDADFVSGRDAYFADPEGATTGRSPTRRTTILFSWRRVERQTGRRSNDLLRHAVRRYLISMSSSQCTSSCDN